MCIDHNPWLLVMKTFFSDLNKPKKSWETLYSVPNNALHFREWLRLMYSDERKLDLGEGYGFSQMSDYAGLYTYRYMKLYSDDIRDFYTKTSKFSNYQALADFDKTHNILNATIRNENLKEDLINAIRSAGYNLGDNDLKAINEGKTNKTNASTHKEKSYYYDDESVRLINAKVRLIIEKYEYLYT